MILTIVFFYEIVTTRSSSIDNSKLSYSHIFVQTCGKLRVVECLYQDWRLFEKGGGEGCFTPLLCPLLYTGFKLYSTLYKFRNCRICTYFRCLQNSHNSNLITLFAQIILCLFAKKTQQNQHSKLSSRIRTTHCAFIFCRHIIRKTRAVSRICKTHHSLHNAQNPQLTEFAQHTGRKNLQT